ncbi:hypothetical protein BTH42_31980 [Burkholderia sp. SRS-W-2-2016]|uniref:hypothetical protein n=1 Tax=Burkholderia sp. SRS-W-2-2016 TaxID=1926878 RepID=UPI00094ABE1C|nr:hypothetical protein [Burkholderia sp. SRS-W-2-2016]OLL27467.1 hypothetical protein BTH42_31980 [Burkholderia sp. SRS-W-2-2016]
MPRQFGYQDAHGFFYSEHPALHFEPGLVPGFYDTDTKTFTPTGNPTQQTGTIVTDAGFGNAETLKSGLSEDKGADTAPLEGVAFTQTNAEVEAAARDAEFIELKRQLEESNRENAQWRARDELAQQSTAESVELPPPATEPEPEPAPEQDAPHAGKSVRRAHKD